MYVVSHNAPFYPEVEHTDSLAEAEEIMARWIEEYNNNRWDKTIIVSIAEVIQIQSVPKEDINKD